VSGFYLVSFFIGVEVFAILLMVAVGALVGGFTDAEFGGKFIAIGGVGDGLNGFEGEDVVLAFNILRGDLQGVEGEAGAAVVDL
jgi:hypothetical protein